MQNSWKEPPEPVCATTKSLVFQISLQVGTGVNIHSVPPPPSQAISFHPSLGFTARMCSDLLPKLPPSQSHSAGFLCPMPHGTMPLGPRQARPGQTRTYFLQKVQVFLPEGFFEKVVRQDEEQKS